MKAATTSIKSDPSQALIDQLMTPPAIDQDEVNALAKLVKDFKTVHEHSRDETGKDTARRAAAAAQAEMDRLIALAEVGMATTAEVQAARDAYYTARESMESYPRRKAALTSELLKMRAELGKAERSLNAKMSIWQNEVEQRGQGLTDLAMDLLFLAAAADYHAGNYPFIPTDRPELLVWLSDSRHGAALREHEGKEPPAVAAVVHDAARVLRDAVSVRGTYIPEPMIDEPAPHHLHCHTTTPYHDHVYDADVARVVEGWGR